MKVASYCKKEITWKYTPWSVFSNQLDISSDS
jgi:hypothetical protein